MKNLKTLFRSLVLFLLLVVPILISNFKNAEANNEEFFKKYRVGAECCDGWDSDATGRGACSHHGGVKYWIYYDDETDEYSYQYTGRCD